ncbi:glycoside hydrolase family 2 TIM barrel-domain containing protein [Lentzea flaviverrucosa]|uniref:beta-galactosidase n=1 Tax=Lentzea flaviverrucosa TaxID=200379 RepID=A0A1H9XSB9_9PSEU|nr:glycoside hydrolase family 2 TIM barrel-domain containing protein [Lentzea flaviverrucosa]RDI19323.1 uncharacterized protein DUF4981 [Lentzea flaviverrucosa]SES49048.1 beta-galactosidase [Lentzea flaviverrucosa]
MIPSHENRDPGRGRLTPRAAFTSDAPALSLNGPWRFRLVSGTAEDTADFHTDDFDDSSWDELPVPAHWQLHGHGSLIHTGSGLPFTVDPPHTPEKNPTGQYRRRFDLSHDWIAGNGGAVLRFDGVDSCFTVWANGVLVGSAEGSGLTHEFYVGHLLRPGRNIIAVRVRQWSAGSYLEHLWPWRLSGIFRDVVLLWRPSGGINDFFVHADYDHVSGRGTLCVETASPAMLTIPDLDLVDAATNITHTLPRVSPWSAEQPRIYEGTLCTDTERIPLRVGFRVVAVVNGVLTANGEPLSLRGVKRAEWHPETGRAVSRESMLEDVLMMKRHNINAVHTSHHPPHATFLDLCDTYGLWVVDECDLEAHDLGAFGSAQSLSDDPKWSEAFLDRVQRTVERDKNHPSVIMWSLGGGSGGGRNIEEMAAWAHVRDPRRLVHHESDQECSYVDIYSQGHVTLAELELLGRRVEEAAADPRNDAHRRALPFILKRCAHETGDDVVGLSECQALFDRYERLAGGFLLDWSDENVMRSPSAGAVHLGSAGPLSPGRTRSAILLQYKKFFEPVRISIDVSAGLITIENRHDHRSTEHLAFTWSMRELDVTIAGGDLSVPVLRARQTVEVPLPSIMDAAAAATQLTVLAVLAADEPWASAGHEIASGRTTFSVSPLSPGQWTEVHPITDMTSGVENVRGIEA